MRMRFLIVFLLFVSCSEAQVNKFFLRGKTIVQETEQFPAISGETSFDMDDIPIENIPPLYISYDIPAGANNALLVYVHGWNGGGGLVGAIDPDAMDYLHSNGIGVIGIGMRGRNTGTDYANDFLTVEVYKDAGALENYDAYKSVKHFIDNVAPQGQIDKTRIIFWVISGGGGAGYGVANKFPGLISTDVIWYGIPKYGTYQNDTRPTLTSWYTDLDQFEGQIQAAIGGAPKGETGYTAGIIDEYYIARDHLNGIGNSTDTKFHLYHDTNDGTVFDDLSDAAEVQLIANGQDYVYHHSSDESYQHGEADLIVDKFSLSPQHGLHWIDDAKTITRSRISNIGTLYVPGYVIPVDEDLEPIFSYWLKSYRKNVPASPSSQARRNQGKAGAATLTYNLVNNTFQTSLIKGNSSVGDQFFFVDITHGANNILALVSTSDVVTLKPVTWNQSPASISSDWKFYYDFSGSDQYLLDDADKVSNVWDLTGNNNIAFQEVRATRASIVSGSLDNGVVKLSGTSGTLATNVDVLTLTNEFTIAFSIDPDQTVIGSLSENILGGGAGGSSLIQFTNNSGKISANFQSQSGTFVGNFTPNNTNLGKQVWVFRRDGSNVVTATCKNSTSTYTYTLGTAAGSFVPKIIGGGASSAKQFSGKIYKVAVSDDRLSDTDVTTLLDAWYGDDFFTNMVTSQTGNLITNTFTTLQSNQNEPPSLETVVVSGEHIKGQILTMAPQGFYSPGAYNQLESLYQWYRADDKQEVGSAIVGATSAQYTSGDDDVAKYIRGAAAAVQDGGLNATGSYVTSIYTEQIQDDEFNPYTEIPWFLAFQPSGATNLAGVGWENDGTGGGNDATQNGTDNIPTYVTGQGVDFESSNAEELILDQPATQFTGGVDVWIRCKFESYNASFGRLLAWTSSQAVEQRGSGAIYLSGGTCDYNVPLNQWVILHFVISQSANTSEFQVNGGTLKTNVAASTSAFGTSNGRIGASANGTGNRVDALISHIFIRQLNATRYDTEMNTWFNTYWPPD